MVVREATLEDKPAWDSFVESEGGGFCHYFDWKHVHEAGGKQFIPLLVEAASSRIVAVLPLVKEKRLLYATLDAGGGGGAQGILFKKDLSDSERHNGTLALLQYVDAHHSRGCSSFRLAETPRLGDPLNDEPTPALVNSGFRFRYDRATGLPCTYVLELKAPFKEHIWKRWPRQLRRSIEKTEESGVTVVQDRDLHHVEDFADMSFDNYRRHGSRVPTRDEIRMQLKVFRDRTKLFVAERDGEPVVALLCRYSPSTCYLARVGSHEKDTDYANRVCWKVAIEDACNEGLQFADFGCTETAGLAFFKERFRGTRLPVRIYERTYSVPRIVMEKAPVLVSIVWHDQGFVWRSRRRLWDRIVHA